MPLPRFLVAPLVLLSFLAGSARAGDPPAPIRAGDRGYGLSVFKGSETLRFEVEILGTLENAFAKSNLYLAKVSGAGLEETGVIAGMSGSPIYVHDRLIGALAYAWEFAREPLAAITPIETMREIPAVPAISAPKLEGVKGTLASLLAADPVAEFGAHLSRAFPALAGPARAFETPISVSGLAPSTFDTFAPLFRRSGFLPVLAGSGGGASSGGEAPRLVPGSSISAVLVGGDLSVTAVGTVTDVDGDRFLGFGHPFLGLGATEIPLAAAEVVGVLPNLARSVKFGNAGAEIGMVDEDRNAGIGGTTSRRARTIPVDVTLRGSGEPQLFHYRLARVPLLLPTLGAIVADSTIGSRERAAGESTVSWEFSADTPAGPVSWRDTSSGAQARSRVVSSFGLFLAYLAGNDVGGTDPEKLRVTFDYSGESRKVKLLGIEPLDREVRAGGLLRLRARFRKEKGEEFVRTVELAVPKDLPPGKVTLVAGSGRTISALELAAVPPDPRRPGDVLAVLSRLHPSTRFSAMLFRPTAGAVLGGRLLRDLPDSLAALLPDHAQAPGAPDVRILPIAEAGFELEEEIEGSARFDVEVKAGS